MKFADPLEQEIFELLTAAGLPAWEAEQEVLALREPLPIPSRDDIGESR